MHICSTMNSFVPFFRPLLRKQEHLCALIASSRALNTSGYEFNKEDETPKSLLVEKPKDAENKSPKEKLSNLLTEMLKDGPLVAQTEENRLETARPKRVTKVKSRKDVDRKSTDAIDEELRSAAKKVAESLGSNPKETEAELLNKILSTTGAANLSEVISGMKVERDGTPKVGKEWIDVRREQGQLGKAMRKAVEGRRIPRGSSAQVDLFGGPRLGIFVRGQTDRDKKEDTISSSPTGMWSKLEERELHLAITHPPRNYFQQMILWTEQGKLWKFPIDNEQGMEEEQNIFFTEHVFLEKHLEAWCPRKGPVRHFMELVCVGLSKNPYLKVEEKKAHIEWYANYFAEKKEILKEANALPE